ncbi:SDR family NAD(P)-dependent oxidoreductase [Variovorax ureilyticus]|uniref:SDR family NAD(P)-dependent oxidoreductase n=1 Tax=Variovorax ureilyticus TaxID=1836198 RepID=UPI003D67E186
MERGTALVLGATGGIGGETASALLRRGWKVRALARDPARAAAQWSASTPRPAWVAGDAMDAASVIAAARGAALIVHAVNPPGYRDWETLVPPMLENTLRAAEATGARIVLPGNVYNYGPDAFPDIDENAPQHPVTRKGAIRVRMEQHLREASTRGVRSLVVRAGDFFGPRAGSNWFAQGLVKAGRPLASITDPGRPGLGHQWTYLPDMAETIAQLVEREHALATFESVHMAGHWDADGTQMQAAIRRASGRPDLPVRRFPWRLAMLASPFVPMLRELREMRYLWQTPVRLRNARLVALLGSEPHTQLDAAVRATLEGLGCIQAPRTHGERQAT